jgi:hypothetical protein
MARFSTTLVRKRANACRNRSAIAVVEQVMLRWVPLTAAATAILLGAGIGAGCGEGPPRCGPFPHGASVTLLDATTGRARWSRNVDLAFADVLVADAHGVYLSNGGRTVVALDVATGRQLWRRAVATGLTVPSRTDPSLQNITPETSLTIGSLTIGHTQDGRLVARAFDKQLVWTYPKHGSGEQFGSLVRDGATRVLVLGLHPVLADLVGNVRSAGPIRGIGRDLQRVVVSGSGIAVLEADPDASCA